MEERFEGDCGMGVPTAITLLTIGGIFMAQSLVNGLAFQVVPMMMRMDGHGLNMIGLVWLLMLPQGLKFLWAPVVEGMRLPVAGGRRSREIMLVGQLLVVLTVAAMAVNPQPNHLFLFPLLAFAAIVTATIDIACDGFAVEQLHGTNRGWGSVMRVVGTYLGLMLGGGVAMMLLQMVGWRQDMLYAIALLVVFSLPLLAIFEGGSGVRPPPTRRPSLGDALARPSVQRGLVAVLLMQPGTRIALTLTAPFLIDRGFDIQSIGLLSGFGGMIAGMVGAIVAGILIFAVGNAPTLLRPVVALQAALFVAALAAALLPQVSHVAIIALILAVGAAGGAGTVILYASMMDWSAGEQPGVDFTVLQSADAMVGAFCGVLAGFVAQQFGYSGCFAVAAVIAGVAAAVVPEVIRDPAIRQAGIGTR